MNKTRSLINQSLVAAITAIALLLSTVQPALADGIIIPDPPPWPEPPPLSHGPDVIPRELGPFVQFPGHGQNPVLREVPDLFLELLMFFGEVEIHGSVRSERRREPETPPEWGGRWR